MAMFNLSGAFNQKTLNELYDTKGYEYLVGAEKLNLAKPVYVPIMPVTAAEARGQTSFQGVLNDMNYPPPSLIVSDFTVRSADLDGLYKPTVAAKMPKFLEDPTVKRMEILYEQELERQNAFFAAMEEAKREGDFRRRVYLQTRGFTETEINEVMKEARKREGMAALDQGMRYAPGGDLTFQHDIRDMTGTIARGKRINEQLNQLDSMFEQIKTPERRRVPIAVPVMAPPPTDQRHDLPPTVATPQRKRFGFEEMNIVEQIYRERMAAAGAGAGKSPK